MVSLVLPRFKDSHLHDEIQDLTIQLASSRARSRGSVDTGRRSRAVALNDGEAPAEGRNDSVGKSRQRLRTIGDSRATHTFAAALAGQALASGWELA